jgi:hypothetical protein
MEEDFTEVFRRYLPKSAVRALLDESLAAHRERLKDDGGEEKK